MRPDRPHHQGTDSSPWGVAGIPAGWVPVPLPPMSVMRFNTWVNAGVMLWARCELRRRWSTLLFLAVLVAVGGGASIAAVAGASRTETAFHRMLVATHQPNVEVNGFGDNGLVDLDPGLLDRVIKINGVTGVVEVAFVGVAPDGFSNFFNLALIDRRGEAMRPTWRSGTPIEDFKTLRTDEAFLNESMSNQLHLTTGDTVVVRTLTASQLEASLSQDTTIVPAGPTLTVRIAGVNRTPEDVSDVPDPFITFSPAFYEQYHDQIGSCRCNVLLNVDPAAVKHVTAELKRIYPDAEVKLSDDLGSRVTDTVSLQRRTWMLIALVAALAAVAALFQASARAARMMLAGDDARRALGMTRRDRQLGRLLVITPAIVVGAAATLGVAYLLSPLAPVGLTRLAEPSPGLRWDPAVVVPGALLVLGLATVVAGTAPLVGRHRASHRRAVTNVGGPQIALGSRLAFGPGRGAIIGVTLSAAGLVGALTLEHSLDHVLATPALYGADFDASNFLDSADDKRSLGGHVAPDPAVDAIGVVWASVGRTVHVVGPSNEADVDPNAYETVKGTVTISQTEGHEPVHNDEVAVGRALMKQLGARIGDHITAQGLHGPVELTIVGDNLDPGVDVAGRGFAMTVAGLSALGDASVQGTVIRFASGTDHAALIKRYSALGFAPVTPPSEVGHIGQLGGLPSRVGQLLTLLGLAALLNAIVLTVRSGRREIALHRALGFTSGQVVRVHIWQSVVTAFVGVVIGGSVGFVVGRAIDRQLVGNVGAIAETVLPIQAWIAAVVIVGVCLFVGVVTSALALRRRPGFELRTE